MSCIIIISVEVIVQLGGNVIFNSPWLSLEVITNLLLCVLPCSGVNIDIDDSITSLS